MNCKKCGNLQEEGDKFCAKCGTPVVVEGPLTAGESRKIIKRKGSVKILKQTKINKKTDIYRMFAIWAGLLLFMLGGIFLFFVSENLEDIISGLIIFMTASIVGSGLYMFFYVERNYIPKKSFYLKRLDKRSYKKLVSVSLIVVIIIGITWFITFSSWTVVIYIIICIPAFIYILVSIKVHEDVDFATNQLLEDIIGMEVDERIFASYQNFDSTKKNVNNNNLIIVTNRKIFYARFVNGKWVKIIRYLDEVQGIGLSNSYNSQYLKLVFTDNSSLILKLNIFDKLTSNPDLFIRSFLMALDSSILGETVQSTRRRRVTISQTKTISEQPEQFVKNETSFAASSKRQIELSTETLEGLSNAVEYTSSRALEL